MGGMTGAASAISNVVGAYTTLSGLGGFGSRSQSADLAYRQMQAQNALQQQQAAQAAALEKQRLETESQSNARKRRAALKRAMARQNVLYGAQGISSEGGSGEAILLGLYNETEEDLADRERLDNLRKAALDQRLENTTALNVLQSTQLAERNRLRESLINRGEDYL
ncbi:MAG: transporter [Pseudobdellovibrionaceae bacterium]